MRVDLCRFRAFAGLLREVWHDLVIPRGGMGAKSRAAALAHLQPRRCECIGDVTGLCSTSATRSPMTA